MTKSQEVIKWFDSLTDLEVKRLGTKHLYIHVQKSSISWTLEKKTKLYNLVHPTKVYTQEDLDNVHKYTRQYCKLLHDIELNEAIRKAKREAVQEFKDLHNLETIQTEKGVKLIISQWNTNS